jgi:hypothetical protein
VSPSGSDSNSGTLAAPFQTLTHAQSVAEGSSIKVVYIESGTYTLTGNWHFGSADTGETWVAYSGPNTVTISGAGNYYIDTDGDNGIAFYGLTIVNMSGSYPNYGASLNLNGTNDVVRWCTFNNFGATAIAGTFQFATIDSNTFNGSTSGQCGGGPCAAVSGYYGAGNSTISHNLCENLAGQCAQFNTANPGQVNDTIAYNLSINTVQNCQDCGTYYAYDTSSVGTSNNGLKIEYNDSFGGGPVTNGTKCIYLDQAISGATITGNICAQNNATGTMPALFDYFVHGGQKNVFTNNIMEVAEQSTFIPFGFGNEFNGSVLFAYQNTGSTSMGSNTIAHNIIFTPNGWGFTDIGIDWNIGSTGVDSPTFSDNGYYCSAGGTVSDWDSYTDSSPSYFNPGFANPAANNYAVSNPPAGWTTLPTNQGPLRYAP